MLLFLGTACQEPKKETPEFVFPASSPVEKILAKGFLDVSTFYSTTDYYIYKGITRGFHYELAQSFADFLGVKLRIIEVNNNLDSAIHRLREGKYDLIAVSMTVTPERQEKIRFTHPLFETGEVLVQNKKKGLLRHITDLNGKTVFIKKDGPYKKLLNHLQDSLQIHFKISEVSGYSSEDLLHLVESGEINYLVSDRNIAQALSASMPDIDYSVTLSEEIGRAHV